MRIFFLLAMSFFLLECATTLSGHLVTADGQAVHHSDARINVVRIDESKANPATHVLQVNEDGAFQTDDLPHGRYLIEALVPGFKPETVRVDVKHSQSISVALSPSAPSHATSIRTHMNIDQSRGSGSAAINPPQL